MLQKPPHAVFEELRALQGIERMHLQGRDMDEETRTGKCSFLSMIAQHMADVLAKEAFDTFAKFLDAIDIILIHAPGAVRSLRVLRLEWWDFLFHL